MSPQITTHVLCNFAKQEGTHHLHGSNRHGFQFPQFSWIIPVPQQQDSSFSYHSILPTSIGGCMGAGGPRGATPCSRSGGATLCKVRSSSCALLEQLWRDIPRPRETQARWYVLQEGIRGQTHWNHNHRKPANLIIWTKPCLTQWN